MAAEFEGVAGGAAEAERAGAAQGDRAALFGRVGPCDCGVQRGWGIWSQVRGEGEPELEANVGLAVPVRRRLRERATQKRDRALRSAAGARAGGCDEERRDGFRFL